MLFSIIIHNGKVGNYSLGPKLKDIVLEVVKKTNVDAKRL
jgi:hypothetical protein